MCVYGVFRARAHTHIYISIHTQTQFTFFRRVRAYFHSFDLLRHMYNFLQFTTPTWPFHPYTPTLARLLRMDYKKARDCGCTRADLKGVRLGCNMFIDSYISHRSHS